ncbi:MAG: hypothetical protein IT560_07230 [Alphaproteobacteria bacterium]|nr:hypothetical protein [Alphaproteobacteria bacterium]
MVKKLPERQKIPVNVIIVRRTPQPDSRRFYSLNRQSAGGGAAASHLKHPENTVNNCLLAASGSAPPASGMVRAIGQSGGATAAANICINARPRL